jgi:ubiquinone biosynthesis protein
MSRRQLRRSLTAASQACPELSGLHLDPEPVGSGSIAGVYRAFAPGGEMLALKLKRPGIDRRMRDDLALIEAFARLGQWLPKLRGMPIADLVGYMSQAILGQLDFGRELRHGEEIRRALCGVPGVVVPRAHAALSSAHCLAFDFVSGLDRRTPRWLPAKVRMQLARRMLAVVHELFFVHGLVHCDLHPGNLYVTIHRQVVVLDAGYCVRLPDAVRRLVGEFFARLATGDGRRCGEIVLASAVNLTADTNTSGFIAEITKLVAETAGPENRFDMAAFGDAVYGLQQRYRIYAASDFAFPLMSLLVADGTVRRLTADVDFQLVGAGVSKPRAGVSNTEEDASAAGGYVGARPSLASQERA